MSSLPYWQYLYGIKHVDENEYPQHHLADETDESILGKYTVADKNGRRVSLQQAKDLEHNIVPPIVYGLDETPYADIKNRPYADITEDCNPVWVKRGQAVLQKVPIIMYVDVSDIGIVAEELCDETETNPVGEYVRGNSGGVRDRWDRLVDRLVNTPIRELVEYMYTEDWQLRKHKLDKYEVNEEDLAYYKGDTPRKARIVPFLEKAHLLAKYSSQDTKYLEQMNDDDDDDEYEDN